MGKTKKHATQTSGIWRVHTKALLEEILNNPGTGILVTPIRIFASLLHGVAAEAIRINDPRLNALMLRLALYEQGDPFSKDYDAEAVSQYINKHHAAEKQTRNKTGE